MPLTLHIRWDIDEHPARGIRETDLLLECCCNHSFKTIFITMTVATGYGKAIVSKNSAE